MAQAPQIDHNGANVELNMAPALGGFTKAANQFAAGTGGATTVVTADADSAAPNVVAMIHASFDAAPAAGTYVQIEDGSGNVVWKQFFPAIAGPYQWTFVRPQAGTVNRAMIVTVSDPGGSVHVTLFVDVYRHK